MKLTKKQQDRINELMIHGYSHLEAEYLMMEEWWKDQTKRKINRANKKMDEQERRGESDREKRVG